MTPHLQRSRMLQYHLTNNIFDLAPVCAGTLTPQKMQPWAWGQQRGLFSLNAT